MMIPPLAAETLFHIGSFPVTNSYVNSTIVALLLLGLAYALKGKAKRVPTGLQNAAEAVIEFFLKQATLVTGDEKKSSKFLPLAATVFLFVLLNNWMGLIPGTGSITITGMHHGAVHALPILRPAASDLNLTIAIALTSIIATNIFGIIAIGFFSHVGKFINLKGFVHALHEPGITKKLIGVLVACVEFAVGLLELVSEIAKVMSLSLRLFGNIFAGEVLMTVMLGLFAYFLPLPFMALEFIVGIVQATVFSMLVLVYATVASQEAH